MDNRNATPGVGLRWHKWMVNFSLWVCAALCLAKGAQLLTGIRYYAGVGSAEMVYAAYGELQVMDIIYGLECVALSVYFVYVRYQLRDFRRGAPRKLRVALALSIVASAGYDFILLYVLDIPARFLVNAASVGSLFACAMMLLICLVYYRKRASLFGGAAPSAPVCPRCGAKGEPGDVYCVQCGTKL